MLKPNTRYKELKDTFGECGKGYFRFSTFGKPEETKEAANRLCKLLTKE